MDQMIAQAVEQWLRDACTPAAVRALEADPRPDHPLCLSLLATGLADALVPEAEDGAGLGLQEAYSLVELCGRFALPMPLAETWLVRGWLAHAGMARPAGLLTMATALRDGKGDDKGDGNASAIRARDVRGARFAQAVLVEVGHETRLLTVAQAQPMTDVEGPDATLTWSRDAWQAAPALVPPEGSGWSVRVGQALVYAALLAGAMQEVFRRSLDYANERQQFGKPIGKFQAIQHQLSVMSEQVVSARMAAQLAYSGPTPWPDATRTAIAKARASEASVEVGALGHSIHGAIGFTAEFDLQLYTRRLQLWRQTAGAEGYWHDCVGAALLRQPVSTLDFLRHHTDAGIDAAVH